MEVKIIESQNEIYQKQRLLGEGAFGKAYLVVKRETGEQLVIKEMSLDHMTKAEREETIKEAQILRNLNHPNIVKFVEVYATKQNKLKIVMQYAECGDLSKAIATRKTKKQYFEEPLILDWFTQICLALKHVHDRKILHRDIKGQNIFITKYNMLKLGDFGIARVLNKTHDKARTVVGTPFYLSPQIIENKPYSFKSDIWSLGVLLYELCALEPPFNATSLQFLALKIVKGSYNQLQGGYSQDLKKLVAEILQIDSNKRPSINQILKKPMILQRVNKLLTETCQAKQFSHTVLHNHKIQITNQLAKFQSKHNQNASSENNQEKNKESEKEEQKLKEKQRIRKKQEEQLKKQKDAENKKRQEFLKKLKQKEQEDRDKKDNEVRQRQRAVIALARNKQRQEEEFRLKKQRLLEEKEVLLQQRHKELEVKKKVNRQKEEEKRTEELNQFARKQYFQNQQIRKRAEERAKQSELQDHFNSRDYQPCQIQREIVPSKKFPKNKKNSSIDKKNNSQSKKIISKIEGVKDNKNESENNLQKRQNEKRKNNEDVRQQMKRDKEEYFRQKSKNQQGIQTNSEERSQNEESKEKKTQPAYKNGSKDVQTIKPGKWEKKKKEGEVKDQDPEKSASHEELKLDVRSEEEFKEYLKELEGLLGNINRNIESFPKEPILSEMAVQEEIVLREDDQALDYSMTASFHLKESQQASDDLTDLNYFSDFSKLEDLRINLEDKFGTDSFIKIYRLLEKELQEGGLERFDIIKVVSGLSQEIQSQKIEQFLPLLLTLIIMEEKMNSQ